jgi:serine/threonine protein phosphatase PrpC
VAIVVETSGKTDVGMKRNHNEDNFYLVEEEKLYLVADGMGGHASGEVASEMAVKTVADFFARTKNDEDVTWPYKMDKTKTFEENRIATGIKLANLRIYETSTSDSSKKGMGTTIVGIFFHGDKVYIAHVGDSRIYRVRSGAIEQMTEDHSLLNDYIKMKKLTPEEIENFPHKNVIVRALGMKETVQVDVRTEKPQVGDVFLLCSDGLSGMISDDDMLRIVSENKESLATACEKMIVLGNKNGGTDNITVVLAKVTAV